MYVVYCPWYKHGSTAAGAVLNCLCKAWICNFFFFFFRYNRLSYQTFPAVRHGPMDLFTGEHVNVQEKLKLCNKICYDADVSPGLRTPPRRETQFLALAKTLHVFCMEDSAEVPSLAIFA